MFHQYHLLAVAMLIISIPFMNYSLLSVFDSKISISIYPWFCSAILLCNQIFIFIFHKLRNHKNFAKFLSSRSLVAIFLNPSHPHSIWTISLISFGDCPYDFKLKGGDVLRGRYLELLPPPL